MCGGAPEGSDLTRTVAPSGRCCGRTVRAGHDRPQLMRRSLGGPVDCSGRTLLRVFPKPALYVGTGDDHVKVVLPRIVQSGSHKGVAHTLTPSRAWHFGMPEVKEVVAEDLIEERRLSICEGDEEALVLRIVVNQRPGEANLRIAGRPSRAAVPVAPLKEA